MAETNKVGAVAGRATACYEGTGQTLESALEAAHKQIRPRHGRDFAVSRVVEWGMQRGGFSDTKLFYVKVIEEEHAEPKG